MVGVRQKTLTLQRSYFNEGFNGSLEEVLRSAFERLPNAKDRIVPIDLISNQFFAGLDEGPNGRGIFVRVVEFEPGAIGVVNLDTEDNSAAVEEFFHPGKRHFLKSELVCYIVADHLVACNMRNKSGTFCQNVLALAAKVEVLGEDVKMKITDVPDKTTLETIREVGVKEVEFYVESYFEALALDTRNQAGAKVMQMIFGSPKKTDDLKHRANAAGRMVLTRGKFVKDEVPKDEWLTDIGQELMVAGSVDRYKIKLEDGTKISNASLKVSKQVLLKRHANSFSFSSAKSELAQWYIDLKSHGALSG
ncbi:MAG: hypothetical protein JJ894_05590 [Dinoroseobacter sp.]|nr:hypothetical protein [Dinoroseobacter sp.]